MADVLTRRQYRPAHLWPRQAPIYLQVGNLFEYADWQIALGFAPDPPPGVVRTSLTLVYVVLGIVGCWCRSAPSQAIG